MADLWIQYMRDALDEVGIEGDTKDKLVEFFTDVAYFLQNVDDDGNRIYGQHPSK
jgi:truncated hemoglobin YjbI